MNIIEETQSFVEKHYAEKMSPLLLYHSIEHVRIVASVAQTIAEAEGLDERNKNIVVVAAWLHDTGYAVSCAGHEKVSCKIAREFLAQKEMEEEFIVEVEKCILSTRIGAAKNSINEKIVGDADNAHAGRNNFMECSNLLRKEMRNFPERKCSKSNYWEETLNFLNALEFHTDYAKTNFEPKRKKNIKRVEKRIKKQEKDVLKTNGFVPKNTARGIETMFRLTARNQINLSSIADNKANMMLTLNTILVSGIMGVSSIIIKAEDHNFLVPGLVLIVGCLVSLIFAVLSVRPKFGSGNYKQEDLQNKKVNLLFFGNIFKMPYKDYEKGVREMMDDYDYLYNTLTKDQYNLGKVLAKKYKLLRYSYNVFMMSFVLAVLTFIVIDIL